MGSSYARIVKHSKPYIFMKTLFRITIILFITMMFTSIAGAQSDSKANWTKNPWSMGDSSRMDDFNCIMENFNMGDFPFCSKRHKYNGHWAGFELGIGGYVTPDFDMNFNPDYPYLNMNTARSIMFNFNPFELNVNIARQKFGFTTGLGFQTGNYYFTGHYVMIQDSANLTAYKATDTLGNPARMDVNKMVVSYLNLPLLFEFQTNRFRHMNSFHVTLGVIAGVRIGSYTKQVYEDKGETYYLTDESGNRVAMYEVEKRTVKERGPYHLSPFKVDAAFRIGWSHLNLFATYSLTQMFQKNQGPEVYPFTVGLTILGW